MITLATPRLVMPPLELADAEQIPMGPTGNSSLARNPLSGTGKCSEGGE